MPPKKKKPGAFTPKGCEVVSVSEVEAGVNSHVYVSGSGRSGTNLTEKDKVDFLCLLRQMSVSSEGNGNRSNSGMRSSAEPHTSHNVTTAQTDITSWSQPSKSTKPTSENSPEWEYLNFQDILNVSQKDQSTSQQMQGQDIKSPWTENLQSKTAENTVFSKGPDQLKSQVFPKPQEISWPAPPGLQQTKFVRQPMSQAQLPMPNFPHAQHQQLPATQGLMSQAQSPFAHIPLPQHPLGLNRPQHQCTQPQLIPHSMPHQPVAPRSPVNPSSPVIRPNSSQNPLNQSGLFMTHPGMSQPWPPPAMLPGPNQAQHTLGVTAKQPFLPVGPVISSRTIALNQQDLTGFRLYQMQQPFSPQKQAGLEQPWPTKEQVPNPQQNSNPQIRPPPGLLNQNLAPSHSNHTQENNCSSQFPGRSESSQVRPPVQNSAQTQEQIHELLGSLALKTGLACNLTMVQQTNKASPVSNSAVVQQTSLVSQPSNMTPAPQTNAAGPPPSSTVVQQTNNVVKNQAPKDTKSSKQAKVNGADSHSNSGEVLKAALNYIDFRGGRPHCIPCQRLLREDDIMLHLDNRNHKDMLEVYDIRMTCNDLPSRAEFFTAITHFLDVEYEQLRISDTQMVQVNDIVLRLNDFLKPCCESFPEDVRKHLEAASIRLYGSIAMGMALKENLKLDLDLNVHNVKKEVSLQLFLVIVKALEKNDSFSDVKHVMADSYSAVTFTDKTTSLPVALSLNNINPYRLSQLILTYGRLDDRVVKLCVLFKAWGRMCQVDNPDDSAFLPHAFPLLVIYYLQKLKLIPVLHELTGRKNDPQAYLDAEAASKLWTKKNVSLGELWVRLFHFYLFEHDVSNQVVCITQSPPFKRRETNWKARRIAIIDPFQPKRNVACHVSQVMSRYIDECFLFTFLHYAVPQTKAGPAFGSIRKVSHWLYRDFKHIFLEFQKITNIVMEIVLSTEYYGNTRPDSDMLRANFRKQLTQIPMFKYLLAMQKKEEMKLFPDIVVDDNCLPGREGKLFADWSVTTKEVNEVFARFMPEKLRFRFETQAFTKGIEKPMWCRACSQVGHKRQDCPDEVMPLAEDLPPLSQKDIDVLNKLCESVCEKWSASEDEITARDSMKDELLKFIREKFPDANLDVFGSSNNGFGSRQSDVDLCMTFADMPDGEGLDFSTMITQIGDMLRKHKDVSEVNAVSMAKVPIVKFTWKDVILVDLSLYNRLGQENTKLLKAYSDIDPRVRPLVYMMKRFVKTACIGDASRGSLSSYAYTLMVLYFLQQVDPPILPVLQELSESDGPPPKKELENANVYFYSDVANIDKVWSHKKNEKTVGELWLDVLDFYVSPKFHESTKVVSIRKLDPLYKVNKMWMSTNLCIEDPFDLAHNLGSGLSRRMNVHIVRSFLRARRHFGSPCPEKCQSIEDYFFDADKLMPGKPPCDRGCRVCGHIGHIRDDCPERRGNQLDQQKPKKKQAEKGTEKGNARQGRKNQDKSALTSNKGLEQSLEMRTQSGDTPPPANATEPVLVIEGTSTEGLVSIDVAEATKKKTAATDQTGKKAFKKALTRKGPKMNPDVPETATRKSDELKAKSTKDKPVKSVMGSGRHDGNPSLPKVTKEKSRTYRNSQRKGATEGAVPKVAIAGEKTGIEDSGSVAIAPDAPARRKRAAIIAGEKIEIEDSGSVAIAPDAQGRNSQKKGVSEGAVPKVAIAGEKTGIEDSGSVAIAPDAPARRKRLARSGRRKPANTEIGGSIPIPVTIVTEKAVNE